MTDSALLHPLIKTDTEDGHSLVTQEQDDNSTGDALSSFSSGSPVDANGNKMDLSMKRDSTNNNDVKNYDISPASEHRQSPPRPWTVPSTYPQASNQDSEDEKLTNPDSEDKKLTNHEAEHEQLTNYQVEHEQLTNHPVEHEQMTNDETEDEKLTNHKTETESSNILSDEEQSSSQTAETEPANHIAQPEDLTNHIPHDSTHREGRRSESDVSDDDIEPNELSIDLSRDDQPLDFSKDSSTNEKRSPKSPPNTVPTTITKSPPHTVPTNVTKSPHQGFPTFPTLHTSPSPPSLAALYQADLAARKTIISALLQQPMTNPFKNGHDPMSSSLKHRADVLQMINQARLSPFKRQLEEHMAFLVNNQPMPKIAKLSEHQMERSSYEHDIRRSLDRSSSPRSPLSKTKSDQVIDRSPINFSNPRSALSNEKPPPRVKTPEMALTDMSNRHNDNSPQKRLKFTEHDKFAELLQKAIASNIAINKHPEASQFICDKAMSKTPENKVSVPQNGRLSVSDSHSPQNDLVSVSVSQTNDRKSRRKSKNPTSIRQMTLCANEDDYMGDFREFKIPKPTGEEFDMTRKGTLTMKEIDAMCVMDDEEEEGYYANPSDDLHDFQDERYDPDETPSDFSFRGNSEIDGSVSCMLCHKEVHTYIYEDHLRSHKTDGLRPTPSPKPRKPSNNRLKTDKNRPITQNDVADFQRDTQFLTMADKIKAARNEMILNSIKLQNNHNVGLGVNGQLSVNGLPINGKLPVNNGLPFNGAFPGVYNRAPPTKTVNRRKPRAPKAPRPPIVNGINLNIHQNINDLQIINREMHAVNYAQNSNNSPPMVKHAVNYAQNTNNSPPMVQEHPKTSDFADSVLPFKQLKPQDFQLEFAKNFPCELCSKRFSSKRLLTVHMKSHSDERPHACMVCGKSFKHSSHKRRHENQHFNKGDASINVNATSVDPSDAFIETISGASSATVST